MLVKHVAQRLAQAGTQVFLSVLTFLSNPVKG